MTTSLELAITAIRSGRKEEGRQLLNLLIQQNPNDEMAWLWMSSVVSTDEQRARCLYHVLAINPNSTIARRGLEVLGIVVSDSRPVKVPRDSQPIPVQRTGAPFPEPPAPVPPPPAEERRPFRIDPRAITQELPFTPLKAPFSEPIAPTPSGEKGLAQAGVSGASLPAGQGLDEAALSQPAAPALPPDGQTLHPSGSVPALPAQPEHDSRPVASEAGQQAPPTQGPGLAATQKLSDASAPVAGPAPGASPLPPAQPAAYPPGQQPQLTGSTMDTRPTPPVPLGYVQPPPGMAMPPQQQPGQPPSEPVPVAGQAYPTMGMPTQYLQPHAAWPPPSHLHSNATMGMAAYPQPYQLAPNPAFYSNVTMAMPTMSPAEARARLMTDYGLPQPNGDPLAAFRTALPQPGPAEYRTGSKAAPNAKREEKEEEEVNLLAVIIFGSLSITALGGLGMLILLMFTGG